MGAEIGLVSCTKSKRDEASPPRELYEPSILFEKARTYCEATHDKWYVLSAKHGLLTPDDPPIEPYDKTLTTASVNQRREWAQKLYTDISEAGLLDPENTIVIHAGKNYYGELLPLLEKHTIDIELPLEGLRQGERLQWYNEYND